MMNSQVNTLLDSRLHAGYSRPYIVEMDTLSERLDEAMRIRGVESQSALARASGVPQPTINRILKGTTPTPDLQTVQKLSAALHLNLEWLAHGVGPGPDSPKRDGNTSLSDEAKKLIQCVIRLDKAGTPARRTLVHTIGILEIVEAIRLVEDADVVTELVEQERLLASHEEQSRVPKHAPTKHKR